MSNPCRICCDSKWSEQAGQWAREGVSDREVARKLGIDKSIVSRHRTRHVLAPMQHQLAIADKGATPRRHREDLAAAASADAPTPAEFVEAFFGLKAQAEKLQRIEDRLERMAALAEGNQSPNGVAQLAAQQLRSVEVGAKVAGVGGYGAQRGTEPVGGQTFSINILFSSGEQVSITPAPGSHLNGEEDPDAGGTM
jgi:hypothetical protein